MFTENCLKTDHEIYVLGTVGYRDDESWEKEDRTVIKKGKDIPFLYISNRAEKEITRRMKWSAIRRLIGGPITFGVCCFLLSLYYDVSLRYIDRPIDISLLFKSWILFGPILAVIIVFFRVIFTMISPKC